MVEPRVLVVDDQETILYLCRKQLERAGFEVHTLQAPQEGIEWLRNHDADLLVVDMRMPAMDGFDLAAAARSLQPDIAILMMTGFGTVETAIQALNRGIDGLILKPFESPTSLVDSARKVLEETQKQKAAARLAVLQPLFEVSESLLAHASQPALERKLLHSVEELFEPDAAVIYTRTDADKHWQELAVLGGPLTWPSSELANRKLGHIAENGQALLISGESAEEQIARVGFRGWTSVMAVPVLRSGHRFIFLVARRTGRSAFRQLQLDLFTLFARQAAVALENARLYDDLESYVRQIEDSQQALVQAEKMAALGRLLVSLAHEINNPLQSVRNCVHLAKREDVPEPLRLDALDLAHEELSRLSKILRQMLNFYRPDEIKKTALDLRSIVQRVLELVELQLRQQSITTKVNFESDLPVITAIQDQIQQVVLNLLLNAMDALADQDDERMIWIEGLQRDGSLVLAVEDSGSGVKNGLEDRIFEPFVSTKASGTGLGLSISYGLVQANGGVLRLVDPRHGRGARFEIVLPLKQDD